MRSMVEGAPLLTRIDDSEDDPLEVGEHLFGRYAHGQKTQILEIPVPGRVPGRVVAPVVRLAIDLDCQTRRQAGEVQ